MMENKEAANGASAPALLSRVERRVDEQMKKNADHLWASQKQELDRVTQALERARKAQEDAAAHIAAFMHTTPHAVERELSLEETMLTNVYVERLKISSKENLEVAERVVAATRLKHAKELEDLGVADLSEHEQEKAYRINTKFRDLLYGELRTPYSKENQIKVLETRLKEHQDTLSQVQSLQALIVQVDTDPNALPAQGSGERQDYDIVKRRGPEVCLEEAEEDVTVYEKLLSHIRKRHEEAAEVEKAAAGAPPSDK